MTIRQPAGISDDIEHGGLLETKIKLGSGNLNGPLARRRKFRRWINRQRCYIALCVLFLILTFVVILPWLSQSFSQDAEMLALLSHNMGQRQQESVVKPDSEKQDLLENKALLESRPKSSHKEINLFTSVQDSLSEQQPFAQTGPTNPRQQAVVDAFRHAWRGYKSSAWGHDHLRPISKGFQDWFGLGLTIVDSIDTIYIMGLKEEYDDARDWIDKKMNFNINQDVNLFETTIRVLGGLLSTYHLSQDKMFLKKAVDLGNRLLPSFQTNSGIPYSDVNIKTGHAHAPAWGQDSSVSEVSSVQLEFRDLSRVTGNTLYEETASKVSENLHHQPKKNGLIPMFINAETGRLRNTATITLGARADSYYEYLLKQWIQTGKTIDWLRDDYLEAVEGIQNNLIRKSQPNKMTFVGELLSGRAFSPKMDHLVCYLPGTLSLGYYYGLPLSHLQLATQLIETCYHMYADTETFLSPEIVYFNLQSNSETDIIIKANDAHNLLRPETIESLWYLYHITGNRTYQEWGWKIFEAFEKHTKVESGGYTSIGDVRHADLKKPRDMMESFFLAETLKYFYMLFSDQQEAFSVSRFIYNTEAHLLPIYKY